MDNSSIIIIGCGGHAKSIIDLLKTNGQFIIKGVIGTIITPRIRNNPPAMARSEFLLNALNFSKKPSMVYPY